MPKVYVADVLCGGGKTTAAINYINASPPDAKFLFVTPYLPECTRVIGSCPSKYFEQPTEERFGRQKKLTKLSDMRILLEGHRNIASTHALFPRYTEDMLNIIREQHYTLFLDEAYDVAKPFKSEDKAAFYDEVDKGTIVFDETGRASWAGQRPHPESTLSELYWQVQNGAVYSYGKHLLIWMFPPEILMAFDKIIILTYLFEAQTLRYYLETLGIEYQLVTTKHDADGYSFCDLYDPDAVQQKKNFRNLIHILDNPKLNQIGDEECSLSSNWYKKDMRDNKGRKIARLAKNVRNVQKNIYKCSVNDFIWTTYSDFEEDVHDKNIKHRFLTWNKKAVNDYRTCHYLAFGINIFAQPDAYKYFKHHGVMMDCDLWALSEMIQWIWRSAIRDGEEIWIYIPSKRMRTLLENWIDEVSSTGLEGGDDVATVSPYHNPADDAGEKNIA